MDQPTPEQQAAVDRVMDQLDALADAWAAEIELPKLIKAVTCPMDLRPSAPADVKQRFRNRMEAQIDAIVRQAYVEAYMAAGDARKEYDEIQMSHLRAELEKALQEASEYQTTFNLQWQADQRAIKRWQAAHPGNDLTWPDRADMVVWLMEQYDLQSAY